MVNQLGKFVPGLADFTAPLRHLLRKDSAWYWDEAQQTAFQQVKEKLASPEILAHYNPNRQTVIAADASSTGLGAVLLQTQDNGQRRPICYISRSLSDAERNYAVIEKEALASTWACERLEEYVLGLRFTLETDHKPLVPLLTTTDLSKMPSRILRFRLRMMRYNPEVLHVPGKYQISADALSRAPVNSPNTLACKQALRMSYFEICFRTARGQRLVRGGQISVWVYGNSYGEPVCRLRTLKAKGLTIKLLRAVGLGNFKEFFCSLPSKEKNSYMANSAKKNHVCVGQPKIFLQIVDSPSLPVVQQI